MLTPQVAADLIGQVFPGARVVRITAKTGGETSAVHEVTTADPAAKVIVKQYPMTWQMRKESYVYGRLPGGLPVPEMLASDDREYAVLTALEGTPLSELPDESRTPDIYRQMGELLRAIHSVPQPRFGYIIDAGVMDPLASNVEYMTRQFETKLREFADLGGDPVVRAGVERMVDSDLFAACTNPVLCHNDFHEGNILVRDGQVTGLIDMENALAGDPALDLAKIEYYSIRGDEPKMAGLLAGYGPAPAGWPDTLDVYRVYHALELWDWFASIGKTEPLAGIMADLRRFTGAR